MYFTLFLDLLVVRRMGQKILQEGTDPTDAFPDQVMGLMGLDCSVLIITWARAVIKENKFELN